MKKYFSLFAIAIIVSFAQKGMSQTSDTKASAGVHPKSYRFYNHSDYEIVDTASFYIYYQYKEVTTGKGLVKTDVYYFSLNNHDAIIPLTINNLKLAFPGNDKFHYALDAYFKSDEDLLAYDYFLKVYKLKYIYRSSTNNNATADAF